MSFTVGADEYDRFMGRYSAPLAPQFADFAAVDAGQRVLDVGCGPGALTAELVGRLGPGTVSAVDPSEPFVAAAQERHPEVSVQRAAAEESALYVSVEHPSFEEWWEPFTLGVGPAGGYAAGLDAKRQAHLRELCREMLPAPPFILTALAWAARGLV